MQPPNPDEPATPPETTTAAERLAEHWTRTTAAEGRATAATQCVDHAYARVGAAEQQVVQTAQEQAD